MRFKLKPGPLLAAVLVAALGICPAPVHAATDDDNDMWWYDSHQEYRVNAGIVRMQVGETLDLRPRMLYESTEREITVFAYGTWSTDRPSVVTVDRQGTVTAHRLGNATVKVIYQDSRFNTITRTVRVKVEGDGTPSAYTSGENYFTITEGDYLSVRELLFQDATAESVRWSTDRSDLLTVDGEGLVFAKRHGTANVFGTYSGTGGIEITRKLTVRVQSLLTDNARQQITITLRPGDRVDLRNLRYPIQLPGLYDTLRCSTGNENVASLNGDVLMAKAAGSCTVTLELSDSRDMTGAMGRQMITVQVVNG